MTPLLNSTPHQDLKDWRKEDARLKAFKESQWERNFGFKPVAAFWITILVAYSTAVCIIIGLIRLTEYALK